MLYLQVNNISALGIKSNMCTMARIFGFVSQREVGHTRLRLLAIGDSPAPRAANFTLTHKTSYSGLGAQCTNKYILL